MTEQHTCIPKHRHRGQQRGRTRTVVCDNSGDQDSLLYGNLQLDDRDRYEGFGVSAVRAAEMSENGDWSVFVDDYDTFKYLRDQEEFLAKAKEDFTGCQEQIRNIEEELSGLREDARDMLNQYGSIEPSVIRKGQYLADRLTRVTEIRDHYQRQVDTANDNLRRLEVVRGVDADEVHGDDSDYNTTHWNLVYRAGQALIDKLGWKVGKLDNPELARLIARVCTQRRQRELTFEHYVHLMGILNGELHRRTGGANFLARRNKMAVLWKKHSLSDRKNTDPFSYDDEVLFDPSERQFGETRLTETELVTAIDLRADASRIAARHNVTFEEAVTMLTEDVN